MWSITHLDDLLFLQRDVPDDCLCRDLSVYSVLPRQLSAVLPSSRTCSVEDRNADTGQTPFLVQWHYDCRQSQVRHDATHPGFIQGSDGHNHASLCVFMLHFVCMSALRSANHFKLKVKVCVCEMWTASCVEEVWEGSTALKRSFVIGWPTYNCVATFR